MGDYAHANAIKPIATGVGETEAATEAATEAETEAATVVLAGGRVGCSRRGSGAVEQWSHRNSGGSLDSLRGASGQFEESKHINANRQGRQRISKGSRIVDPGSTRDRRSDEAGQLEHPSEKDGGFMSL